MRKTRKHAEVHKSGRSGWLRAAVLGSNDGIVSTSSLVLGVAATSASTHSIAVAGIAGLVAGAASMAAGEYVSVSSQRDAEAADIRLENEEQKTQPAVELNELKEIYVARGLDDELASRVAKRFMEVDPLGTHLRDELGLDPRHRARPVQAALVSAVSFAAGAALPLLALWISPESSRIAGIGGSTALCLGVLGALAGKLGGASPWRAALRVCIGGILAMVVTAAIGHFVGVVGL